MRFAVYNYVGWTVALLVIMLGGVVVAVMLLRVKEHLFQVIWHGTSLHLIFLYHTWIGY